MRKKLFLDAWYFYRSGLFLSFSEALKASWAKTRIVTRLRMGATKFTFEKVGGEIREAVGTLDGDMFSYESKGSTRKPRPDVIAFWDLEKDGFRSFRIEKLKTA